MADLRKIQISFSKLLRGADHDLDDLIVPAGALDPSSALDVYRQGYIARLTEALSEAYPALRRALGEGAFYEICASYIDSHDSSTGNLSDYGGEIADFLLNTYDSPALRDLARLEWKFQEVFHAREEPSIDLATAGLDGNSRLIFSPASALVFCVKGVYDFWRSGDMDRSINIQADGVSNPDPASGPFPDPERGKKVTSEACLLFRREFRIYSEIFDEAGGLTIQSLMSGKTVSESLRFLDDRDPSDVTALFRKIASTAVIVKVKL